MFWRTMSEKIVAAHAQAQPCEKAGDPVRIVNKVKRENRRRPPAASVSIRAS
jgi:hypothetical protein